MSDYWSTYWSGDGGVEDVGYDIAEICLNGHVINDSVIKYPADCKKFCDLCGSPTIQKCQSCQKNIQGYEHGTGVAYPYSRPSYCMHCGDPFPWIRERLTAAQELAEIVDEFSPEDKRILVESLEDLVRDSPKSQVAAIKFKKTVAKTTGNIASAFRDILIDVTSESVKRMIWPG